MKLKPVICESDALSESQLRQMHEITRLNNPLIPNDHIQRKHISKVAPTFYLYYEGQKMLAFQGMCAFRLPNPFRKGEIPVFFVAIAFRRPEAAGKVRDFARQSNIAFIRSHLGPFFFLKTWASFVHTVNPKLTHRFLKSFPISYPQPMVKAPRKIQDLTLNILHSCLGYPNAKIDPFLVRRVPEYAPEHDYYLLKEPQDITARWEEDYCARDEAWNQHFIELGIVQEKPGFYGLLGPLQLMWGFFSPFAVLRKKLGLRPRRKTAR